MNPAKNDPVTRNDAELIFRLLDVITAEIHRLFDAGMVLERADDYEVEKIRNKIDRKQGDVKKLRQMLTKTRQYISRRKELERQRQKKKTS